VVNIVRNVITIIILKINKLLLLLSLDIFYFIITINIII